MKQQQLKNTRIAKILAKYASNQAYILKVAKVNEFEYNQFLFECGCRFLEEIFPESEGYGKYYKEHAYSQSFWKWFKVEYYQWENGFVDFIKLNNVELDKWLWKEDVGCIAMDGFIERSFQDNYQKRLKYVI